MVSKLKLSAFSLLESIIGMVFLTVVISLTMGVLSRYSFKSKTKIDNQLYLEFHNAHSLNSVENEGTVLNFKRVADVNNTKVYNLFDRRDNAVISFLVTINDENFD